MIYSWEKPGYSPRHWENRLVELDTYKKKRKTVRERLTQEEKEELREIKRYYYQKVKQLNMK